MPLTRIELVNVTSTEDFYRQLEAQVEVDEPVGHDLDSAYEVLSTELAGPIELLWHDAGFSRVALGDDFARIIDMLNVVSGERADFHVSLD